MAGTKRELLPSDVLPEHYDLTLEPDVEKFTFDGVVKITCDVQVATDSISVHAHELVLSSATFTPSEGSSASSAESITLKTKSKMAVARKATFTVTMIYPANLMAISNMPPSSLETRADGKKKETRIVIAVATMTVSGGEWETETVSQEEQLLRCLFCRVGL
eukprot:g26997.t1